MCVGVCVLVCVCVCFGTRMRIIVMLCVQVPTLHVFGVEINAAMRWIGRVSEWIVLLF